MAMRRKLIKQGGGGGLTLYLPRDWIDRKRLRPGDEVDVQEDGEELIVTAGVNRKQRKSLTIDVAGINRSRVRTALSAAYRRGFDEVILHGSRLPLSEMEDVVASLLGFVIVEQTPSRVVIHNAISDDFDSLPGVLDKMFVTAGYILNGASAAEAESLRRQSMRLRDYCQRMIHLKVFAKDRAFEYYVLVAMLEKIAMRAALLTSASLRESAAVKEAADCLRKMHAALGKKDIKAAFALNDRLAVMEKAACAKDARVAMLVADLYMLSSRVVAVLV